MIAFLDNIYDLLMWGPDSFSSLSGLDLVKSKVIELVMQVSVNVNPAKYGLVFP